MARAGQFYGPCKKRALTGNKREVSDKGGGRGVKTDLQIRFNAESSVRGLAVEKKDRTRLGPDGANHEIIEMCSIMYSGVGCLPLLPR